MISKILAYFLLIICFLKSFYYGTYEIKNNSIPSGNFIIIISTISLIFSVIAVFMF